MKKGIVRTLNSHFHSLPNKDGKTTWRIKSSQIELNKTDPIQIQIQIQFSSDFHLNNGNSSLNSDRPVGVFCGSESFA